MQRGGKPHLAEKPSNCSAVSKLGVHEQEALPADSRPVHSTLPRERAISQRGLCVYQAKNVSPPTATQTHNGTCIKAHIDVNQLFEVTDNF